MRLKACDVKAGLKRVRDCRLRNPCLWRFWAGLKDRRPISIPLVAFKFPRYENCGRRPRRRGGLWFLQPVKIVRGLGGAIGDVVLAAVDQRFVGDAEPR